MSSQQGQEGFDLTAASELAQDYKLLQARNSKKFVATMVDVCAAINACPIGKLKNLDVEELKNQTGHILYYQIKGVDEPVPCDIDFVPKLHSHFRKPSILVLRRIQKFLMAPHRRILGKLEREQALERVLNMGAFDVAQKIRLALDEMKRFEKMAKMVRGGGRKLDILMQALKVPARARFELLLVDRILKDHHHPRHNEAMQWLANSKFKGNPNAAHSLILNGFQMLDTATNRLLDIMEDLSGLTFSRDSEELDLQQNWYALGNALPRGEEFVKAFTAEEKVEQRIKRLTYPMVRVSWDSERLRAHKDKLILDLTIAKIQSAQLCHLFFELEKKITASTKPDGEVMAAIETDFENGMLSVRERDEAEAWVRENKLKLQELVLEIYEALQELKEKNPKINLPQELEDSIKAVKSGHAGDRESHRKAVETQIGQVTIDDLLTKVNQLEKQMDRPGPELLDQLSQARTQVLKRIDSISMRNIDFHKKVRDAYADFSEYENKVIELYQMEEKLEQLRIDLEGWLVTCYRTVPVAKVPEKVLTACVEIIVERLLSAVRKLDYQPIDAGQFETVLEAALNAGEEESIRRLDLLLQEINAVPASEALLTALKDWEKDLGKEKFNEKEAFILANEGKLQDLSDRARAELRERINEGKGPPSRRLRFEVFGLSDCLAENIRLLMKGLMVAAPRAANAQEGEQLAKSLATLEAQIIEAQKMTRPNGEAYEKLKHMKSKGQISEGLARELDREMKLNFSELDQVLDETNQALVELNLLQNRFGAEKETDYLEITLNINDLERLKDVYEFLDTVTMEDIKRFCVAYNLKTGLTNNLFEKAKKKDLSVPKEVLQLFNGKVYKAFRDKRYISLPLKTAILHSSKETFEAECQLLCHTLNLVNPMAIRKKASYVMAMTLLGQAKDADHQVTKLLGLLWGRMQTRLFNFKPVNHSKNFEGNRQALITDIKDQVGDKFRR